MVLEDNWRSIWTRQLSELGDAPIGRHCGDTMELEGTEPNINPLPTSRDIPTQLMKQSISGLVI
jgi:hypothetical protein